MIKDSGERREFSTGAVRDIQEGKGRCDLMPLDVVAGVMHDDATLYLIAHFVETGNPQYLFDTLDKFGINYYKREEQVFYEYLSDMFLDVAKHFEDGAKKYGENNWQKGIPVHCYIDSAVRHYLKFRRGDDDEPHDRAFVWNIMCCIWTLKNHPELDDIHHILVKIDERDMTRMKYKRLKEILEDKTTI